MVYKRFYPVLEKTANRILAGHSCVFCGLNSKQSSICKTCKGAIRPKTNNCYQCGKGITVNTDKQKCGDCIKEPKVYRRLVTACHYDFPINKAISQFKFHRQLHLGKALSELLAETIRLSYQKDQELLPELILPIPLHHKRLAERSFNQSELIAMIISQKLQISSTKHILTRIKNTPHQTGLKAVERRKNLKNAFEVKQTLPKHIALVDDVVTTGTTITETTKLCLKNGAEKVDIWCLAKT